MKIALIQCPVWGTYDPPMALAQLSACLKKDRHIVSVYDLNIELYLKRAESYRNIWAWEQCEFWYNSLHVQKFFNDNKKIIEEYIEDILSKDIQVACFSVSASSRLASLKFVEMLKKKRKDIVIIFGGTLFFKDNWIKDILKEEYVDIVIPGEGELTLCELLNSFEKNNAVNLCKGVAFKKNGQIINYIEKPLMNNLDMLPFLDFSDLPLTNYDDSKHLVLMTSRGCVQCCVFCSSREFWEGYRGMSGERIFRELEYQLNSNPEVGHVDFMDLVFNGNIKALKEFCSLIIARLKHTSFDWKANVIIRPEMTPELLKDMRRAGCSHLIYGIESGSQRILNLMRKRYKITDADNVIKATHDAGITVTANFMFGFPGESVEDFQLTLDFIKRNAHYLDRVYPSRTFCAIEEFSYLSAHLEEFNIKSNLPNHLYWESIDGKNTYPERLRRCEEFCNAASSLGIEVGCGVQTSVELDRWFNLGHYYEQIGDFNEAKDCFLRYCELDEKNEVILNKIKDISKKIEADNIDIKSAQSLKNAYK